MEQIYTVKRDDICVGKVITDFEIDEKKYDLFGREIKLGAFYKYRSMLFVKTYDNCADDLLYTSPLYPIYTEENADVCKKSKIIIDQAHNLSRLLKYHGYNEELDFFDVESIRKRFFNGKFQYENAQDFGLIELDPSLQLYYDNKGQVINDPYILKKLIKQRKRQQLFSSRLEYVYSDDYEGIPEELLSQILIPHEYFEILKEHGNNSLYDVIHGYEERIDAFKPHKEEGMIRSLKKYN